MSRTDARSSPLRRHPSRTVPATITAVVLVGAGVTLVWVCVVRAVTGRWPAWVGQVHEWLGTHPWSSPTVLLLGGLLALVGVVLLASGLTPGRPTSFALETGEPDGPTSVEYAMSRRSVARLVTARASMVEGIESVRTTVSRRAVELTVVTASAQREAVEQVVTQAVTETLSGVGLSPLPRVSTTVATTDSSRAVGAR